MSLILYMLYNHNLLIVVKVPDNSVTKKEKGGFEHDCERRVIKQIAPVL